MPVKTTRKPISIVVTASLILLAVITIIFIGVRIWTSSHPLCDHSLDQFYFIGDEPLKTALSDYGAKPAIIDSLSNLPAGSQIIIGCRSGDLDYSLIKALAKQHTIFLIDVDSTKQIASLIFDLKSYEEFLGSDHNLKQLIKIGPDQSGRLTLVVISYLDPEIAGYQDLVKAISR